MAQISIVAGGRGNIDVAMVSADQVTILGNGTTENPLRTASGGSGATLQATLSDLHQSALKGMIWTITSDDTATRLDANDGSRCIGLLTELIAHPNGQVGTFQYSGEFVMTTDEWDAIAGTTGGLVAGALYFASLTTPGEISSGIIAPGDLALQIGIGKNPTTMILMIAPPVTV